MSVALPKLRVGDRIRHDALCVFPLFAETVSEVEYRLSDEALADGSLRVGEVSEAGSVPNLLVENKGDLRVLFLEGEELVGAKQNRILNTSVLVGAHTRVKIPVSCVERGRWNYKSRYFGSSGSQPPSKLRRALKASVSRAVKEKRGHHSDQGEVWQHVAALHAAYGVESDTAAMSDAFLAYGDRIAAFREHLKYVKDAVGAAVAIGGRVVSIDVFDKPTTCQKVWNRLLSGVIFDALEAGHAQAVASVAVVEGLVAAAGDLPWEEVAAVGEGAEYRADVSGAFHASALAFENTVVHGSFVQAV